jgi:nicotinamidase-related amidase
MPLLAVDESLLLVIDAQPGFLAQSGMEQSERDEAAAALARLRWLAGIAGLLDVPAVVSEEAPDRNGATDAEVMARLGAASTVLVKRTFSVAGAPELLRTIEVAGRHSLVLTGFETDTCVDQSARELLDLGYRVVAVQDACFSTGPTEHARGIARMRDAGVEINDVKSVTFEWCRAVERANALDGEARERFGEPPIRL